MKSGLRVLIVPIPCDALSQDDRLRILGALHRVGNQLSVSGAREQGLQYRALGRRLSQRWFRGGSNHPEES